MKELRAFPLLLPAIQRQHDPCHHGSTPKHTKKQTMPANAAQAAEAGVPLLLMPLLLNRLLKFALRALIGLLLLLLLLLVFAWGMVGGGVVAFLHARYESIVLVAPDLVPPWPSADVLVGLWVVWMTMAVVLVVALVVVLVVSVIVVVLLLVLVRRVSGGEPSLVSSPGEDVGASSTSESSCPLGLLLLLLLLLLLPEVELSAVMDGELMAGVVALVVGAGAGAGDGTVVGVVARVVGMDVAVAPPGCGQNQSC
jgi:hypothetical protein